MAGPDDVVIDLDDCFAEVCGIHGHDAPGRYIDAALMLRNAKIDALAGKKTGRAFIIAGCPTDREAEWWRGALGCEVVTMPPALWEIEQRDISPSRKRLAAKWFHKRLVDDWKPPSAPREVGLNGY